MIFYFQNNEVIESSIEDISSKLIQLQKKVSNFSTELDNVGEHVIKVAVSLNHSGNILDAVKVDLQTYAEETGRYDDMRFLQFFFNFSYSQKSSSEQFSFIIESSHDNFDLNNILFFRWWTFTTFFCFHLLFVLVVIYSTYTNKKCALIGFVLYF